MKADPSEYAYSESFDRLMQILDQSDVDYDEVDSLPPRHKLTFTNGFYANCSAMLVDIRDSSALASKYERPTLARIYRAYISELVAIMNRDPDCHEINIVGDGVWCVVNTPKKTDIDYVFSTAAMANSMLKVLNYRLRMKGLSEIKVGIGLSWGRALMIKAGFAGDGINEVVYVGEVVNEAAKLAALANSTLADLPIFASDGFRFNLDEDNKKLLEWNSARSCWHGNFVNTLMNDWYSANCT